MINDYRHYELSIKERVWFIVQGLFLCAAVDCLFYRSLIAGIISLPLSVLYMRFRGRCRVHERQKRLLMQFRDATVSMKTAIMAGYSLENAVRETFKDMEELHGRDANITCEFGYIVAQMSVNIPVEELLLDFGDRSGLDDILNFARVLAVAKRSGGDTGSIMENTARRIGDKIEVKKEIDAVISAKKFEQTIMSFMPAGIIVYMQLTSPGFMDVLYGNLIGVFVMTVVLGLYVFSFFLGRKIVSIEV